MRRRNANTIGKINIKLLKVRARRLAISTDFGFACVASVQPKPSYPEIRFSLKLLI
jgi:hypothetical protein